MNSKELGQHLFAHVWEADGHRMWGWQVYDYGSLLGATRDQVREGLRYSGLYPKQSSNRRVAWSAVKWHWWQLDRTVGKRAPTARRKCPTCGQRWNPPELQAAPDPRSW
ncbi:hypothetical protein ACFV9E_09040 [Streptomyces sp. NPDC059835]|uniref:hypothetical protein n=1 Tax=Streptomyces sp. NPDC059835 TaxID=3346967 RepID=UPI003656F74E